MKKLLILILIFIITITLSGCLNTSNLENAKIYTTVYPISYIAEELYKDHGTVDSIYPSGASIEKYSLTEKQKKEYAKGSLFIYNGLNEEKQIAKDLINYNGKLLIIDVSNGLKYNYGIEELWLSPNNFLMLAKNTKENLIEYVNNKYLAEEIQNNYEKLEETISVMDANLRNIATTAAKENKSNTLIVSSNVFKYLENYGFTVISLEDEENLSVNNLNAIKSNFKNNTYNTIIMRNTDEKTDLINNLVDEYKANILAVDTMVTLSDESLRNNYNYLSIIQNYISDIQNIVLN